MRKRPTSPHLLIYSPLITSASSIIGRAAGVYVYLLTLFLGFVMAFNIQGRKDIGNIISFLSSTSQQHPIYYALLILFTFVSIFFLFFYIFAILRHIIWDFGYLLELPVSKIMGYLMFIFSLIIASVLTIYMFFL